MDFKVGDNFKWFVPRISTIIGDWPEACTFSLTYKSANSNYPCHFCLVSRDKLISTEKDQVVLRNHNNMKTYYKNGNAASVSLEDVENYFWNIL